MAGSADAVMVLVTVGTAVPVAIFHKSIVAVPASTLMSHAAIVHAKLIVMYTTEPEVNVDPAVSPKVVPKLRILMVAAAVPATFATVVVHDPADVVTSLVNAGVAPHGKLVALVRTKADGVPSAGVVSVGLVARTTFPDPVVDAETGCALPFDPITVADVGNDVPLILAVVVAHDPALVVVSPVSAGRPPQAMEPAGGNVCGFCNSKLVPSYTAKAIAVVVRSLEIKAAPPNFTIVLAPRAFTFNVAAPLFALDGSHDTI